MTSDLSHPPSPSSASSTTKVHKERRKLQIEFSNSRRKQTKPTAAAATTHQPTKEERNEIIHFVRLHLFNFIFIIIFLVFV
jgi:hypothetical protein